MECQNFLCHLNFKLHYREILPNIILVGDSCEDANHVEDLDDSTTGLADKAMPHCNRGQSGRCLAILRVEGSTMTDKTMPHHV